MRLISRAQWGARAPRSRTPLHGADGVAIHWNGPRVWPRHPDHAVCDDKVRAIQNFHMNQRGWSDIAYSLVACPHGYLFEARGVHTRTAANGTRDGNNRFYAIMALRGQDDPLWDDMKRGIVEGVHYLRNQGGAGGQVKPHSAFKSTSCPGDELRAWINQGMPLPDAPPSPPDPAPTPSHQHPQPHTRMREITGVVRAQVYHPEVGRWFTQWSDGAPWWEVRDIQNHLIERGLGHLLEPYGADGWGGPKTDAAIREFQRRHGLYVDGWVGPSTWPKLH